MSKFTSNTQIMSNIFCNNCGNQGHLFHNCKKPITSIGIICFRFNEKNKYDLELLMVQRKDSMGYVDILRGKYNLNNEFHIRNIMNELTLDEYTNIQKHNFKTLWIKLWDITNEEELKNLTYGKNNNEYKLDKLRMSKLFRDFKPKYSQPEWGFPKGRRNSREKDIDCALREFEEETGIMRESIKLVQNVYTLEENFTGSNLKSYKHKYYLAYIPYEHSNNLNNFQRSEIGNMKWMSINECMDKIRDYNFEKKDLVERVHHIITQYFNKMNIIEV